MILLPKTVKAADFTFQGNIQSLPTVVRTTAEPSAVRNDFSLTEFVKRSFGSEDASQAAPLFDPLTLDSVEVLRQGVDQASESADLEITDGWAVNFVPGQNGQTLDLYQLGRLMADPSASRDLPVHVAAPKTSLASTNSLGITELLATGESDFTGSSKSRITNIKVGASKFNGLILKPGEEFSFNRYLGEIDAAHGFLPEMVIKREGVVPEFGGGLCQVSSTAFRAAMNAGLPITERRNHSFAVAYYAPQGTDATIYPGAADFRFINDLSSSLLIRTRVEGKKLYFDFYGTRDGRTVEFDGPRQYDRKPDGSMKAVWTRRVTKAGNTSEQVFRSNYVSPNLFKKETTVQTATPNPEASTSAPTANPPAPATEPPTTNPPSNP